MKHATDTLTKVGIAVVVLITIALMSWLAGWKFLVVPAFLACLALEFSSTLARPREGLVASKELFPRFVLKNTFLGNVEPENQDTPIQEPRPLGIECGYCLFLTKNILRTENR